MRSYAARAEHLQQITKIYGLCEIVFNSGVNRYDIRAVISVSPMFVERTGFRQSVVIFLSMFKKIAVERIG